MKKILSAILAVAIITTLLCGCSLFGTGSTGGNAGGSDGPIQMTDKYSFTDPTDLEYEKRYVIYGDENSTMVSSASAYGMVAVYSITYATADDKPAGGYEFVIVDSEEHAQALKEFYLAQGQTLSATEEDPCVLYAYSDGDTMEGVYVTYQSMGMIKEATVSAYVEFYAATLGGTVQ